jgi:ribosome-associated toxin RatA of RatAB toxin-antitoxin module
MTVVKRTALVTYSQEQMYRLVDDVDAYADFLPWCKKSQVIERNETEVVGQLEISKSGITKTFATRNTLHPVGKIEIALENGPFKRLDGHWIFHNIQDQGTKIELELEFEFEKNWMGKMLNKLFSSIADNLLDAFCKRAEQLYG